MIHFNDLWFKNFLSVGDQPTHIQLDKDITSIITGTNGAGKSTFIDALVYALFGKPFRKVKLGQLINKVNEKGLEVTVTFTIGKKKYKVIRGQKPAKFEIWCNDDMIEQPAKTADYQQILENDILKLSFNSFTQIIVLGSASFTPFMQLKLADRREIIESILDISVFSKMNVILKAKMKDLRDEIISANHTMDLTKQDHSSKLEYFTEATTNHINRTHQTEKTIEEIREKTRLSTMNKDGHNEYIDELETDMKTCSGFSDKYLVVMADIESLKRNIDTQKTRFDLLKNNNSLVEEIKVKIDGCNEEISKAEDRIAELSDKNDDLKEVLEHYKDLSDERDTIRATLVTVSNRMVADKLDFEFYEGHDDCSECGQIIHADFKKKTMDDLDGSITADNVTLKENKHRLDQIDADNKDKQQFTDDSADLDKRILSYQTNIARWQNSIDLMTADIQTRDTEDNAAMGDLNHLIGLDEESLEELIGESVEIKEKHAKHVDLESKLTVVKKDLAISETEIYNYVTSLEKLYDELATLKNAPVCSVTQDDIDALAELVKNTDKDITKKKHMLHYYDIVQKLLKDDGLKTRIIRKFLPVINATVNMYLDKFDFPINFEFDENFNETIQSKFRNDFSYYSFSEGEKSRIDLALLFTWRDTALKKARNACNIIIFDEIFDGSLDGAGIENFMSILGLDDGGYNSFIISHKDETINSRFDRCLEFNKDGHFSKIMEK